MVWSLRLRVGTSSIGYAVRKGKQFFEVGVEQCPPSVQNLKDRRDRRRAAIFATVQNVIKKLYICWPI